VNKTVPPLTEHAPAVLDPSIEKPTGKPELAVAPTMYLSPITGLAGAVVVNEMVWESFTTSTGCCCCGAGRYVSLPTWLASITHVPTPVNDTVPALTEHAPAVLEPSIEKFTGSPDVADAATAYTLPMFGLEGAVELNEIVCACFVMRTGTTGSTITPLASPSASPRPPSVKCRVIVLPEMVASDVTSTYEPLISLNTFVGSLPGGSCIVTLTLPPGVSPLTV
jgi:hypothetical protein